MRGATAGIERKIQDVFPNAHYIHCYAHQLNLIMQQATSHISKLQKRNIDLVHINGCIQQFQQDIQKIRNSLHSMVEQSSGSQPTKRRWALSPEDHEGIAAEVCDTILGHTREHFFTNHLVSATLLQEDRFEQYKMAFPEDSLSNTMKAYPMLNGSKLKPVVVLWSYSSCLWRIILKKSFQRLSLS
ncbi:hypothetical protein MATL_G00136830 [Megalops atlanticus]|uniref:Uncharacterized protein n=1 Tax=Megalops atlanticus TaxID=7932 RepID=A0A9D3T2N2_MEGAT|nr:hypothetical protein MATL_G00136830 [Megalops atlanticus]